MPCAACGCCGFGYAMPQRQRIAGNGAVVEVGDGLKVPCAACGRSGFECAMSQRQQIRGNAAVVDRKAGRQAPRVVSRGRSRWSKAPVRSQVYRPTMRACWGPTVRTGPVRVPRPSTDIRPSRQNTVYRCILGGGVLELVDAAVEFPVEVPSVEEVLSEDGLLPVPEVPELPEALSEEPCPGTVTDTASFRELITTTISSQGSPPACPVRRQATTPSGASRNSRCSRTWSASPRRKAGWALRRAISPR